LNLSNLVKKDLTNVSFSKKIISENSNFPKKQHTFSKLWKMIKVKKVV